MIKSLLFAVALPAATSAAWALDPALPPGRNFDLSHWKLTLPELPHGQKGGVAAEIGTDALVRGYVHPEYFFTDPADGAMVFHCPAHGAKTKTTHFPRSELREMLSPPQNAANWDPGRGHHRLTAECAVTELPGSGMTIIGQIHGFSGKGYPLVKLRDVRGLIQAQIKLDPESDLDTDFPVVTVPAAEHIHYTIAVDAGRATVTVNGHSVSADIRRWNGQSVYYKAGNYCQDHEVGAATVKFYALAATHAP